MKKDLDQLMQKFGIDVLFITGPAQHNPAMVYLTGGGHITLADLIKKRGEPAVLFHAPMEREEAARTGLRTICYTQYPFEERMKQCGGDLLKANALRYRQMFADLGIHSGKVAVYGEGEVGSFYSLLAEVQKELPEMEFFGFQQDELLMTAMMTKDVDEIARIKRMGEITTEVVGMTAEYLTSKKASNGILVHEDSSPVTIGEVKKMINLWLAERNAENPEGTIFAQGHDAGVPHSTGTDSDPIRLGDPIVYDIFPCEAGGGYFYDFTRTWCVEYANEGVQALYDQVFSTYMTLASELKVNTPFSHYQARTCELFDAMGHPTILKKPDTEEGYVHSLGHGVGLRVHEKPSASMSTASPTDILAPGSVFTMEPGLYYPDRNIGIRIEDTYVVKEDGKIEILADYPKDLILKLKK